MSTLHKLRTLSEEKKTKQVLTDLQRIRLGEQILESSLPSIHQLGDSKTPKKKVLFFIGMGMMNLIVNDSFSLKNKHLTKAGFSTTFGPQNHET